jgi:hypothetical protein
MLSGRQVLDLVPEGLPLTDALPLLGGLLLHATETSRNQAVVRSLRRSDNLVGWGGGGGLGGGGGKGGGGG